MAKTTVAAAGGRAGGEGGVKRHEGYVCMGERAHDAKLRLTCRAKRLANALCTPGGRALAILFKNALNATQRQSKNAGVRNWCVTKGEERRLKGTSDSYGTAKGQTEAS